MQNPCRKVSANLRKRLVWLCQGIAHGLDSIHNLRYSAQKDSITVYSEVLTFGCPNVVWGVLTSKPGVGSSLIADPSHWPAPIKS